MLLELANPALITDGFLWPGLMLAMKAGLVIALAFTANFALRRGSARARLRVWTVTFAFLIVLPVLPKFQWRVLPAPAVASLDGPAPSQATSLRSAPTSQHAERTSGSTTPPLTAGDVYLLVALLLCTRIALQTIGVWRQSRGGRTLVQGSWSELLEELSIPTDPKIGLIASDDARQPYTFGLSRHTIVLPSAALGWDRDSIRNVLLHELAHIRRRDFASHLLVSLVCVCYWPLPLVWWARKRMGLEREMACDAEVTRSRTLPSLYASQLLALAHGLSQNSSRAGEVMALTGGSQLQRRIQAILRPPPKGSQSANTASASCCLCLGLLLAAVEPASSAAGSSASESLGSIAAVPNARALGLPVIPTQQAAPPSVLPPSAEVGQERATESVQLDFWGADIDVHMPVMDGDQINLEGLFRRMRQKLRNVAQPAGENLVEGVERTGARLTDLYNATQRELSDVLDRVQRETEAQIREEIRAETRR